MADPAASRGGGEPGAEAGLRRCVGSVLTLGRDLDATSIAEALWLAASRAAPAAAPLSAPGPEPRKEPAVGDERAAPERIRPAPQATPAPDRRAGPAGDHGTETEPLVTGRRALVGRARPVPQPLDLSRALRPFKRRWPDGKNLQLDIEETVRSYARTWKLVPKFRAAPERWFEVDIVIDDSPSMIVWGDLISVLSTLLRQLGAFRTIRTWRISVTGPKPLLHNEGGQPAGAGQLRSPGGRRLIILVSDGSAAGWLRPEAWALVRNWAGSTPTALISPLATRLWGRTGLGLPAARVGPGAPGSGNAQLQFAVPRHELGSGADSGTDSGTSGGWLPLPVCTPTPYMLGRWARTLMKADPRGCDALLIPPVRHPPEPDADDAADPVAAGAQLVNAFRRAASPEAARLAVLCAPFSAVSLELLELLSAELIPEASTADLAEVMVGGLFRPAATRPGNPGGDLLRFRPGVRERLRELLPETDAWRAYNALIKHVTERSGADAGVFAAGVPDPLGDIAIPAALLPFAAASREALEFLDAQPAPWLIAVARPPSGSADPVVWGNVPARDPNFTGREAILDALRRSANDRSARPGLPAAVQGLSGAGKTAIAVEYAHRHVADYDAVWWVQADEPALVTASLAALAARLGVAPAESGAEEAAKAALDALRRGEPYRRWLMIFDRADQPETLAHLLPQGPGDVLITSRNLRWPDAVETAPIDVFARAESVHFLRRLIPGLTDEAEADELAADLGDLPLALAQAGALIAETRMPVTEYRVRLAAEVTKVLTIGIAAEYQASLTAAWRVTIAELRERMPEAIQLLSHLAFLDGDQISVDVLLAGAGELGFDSISLTRALDGLVRFALVSYTSHVGQGTICVHRLVQAMAREELDSPQRDAYRHRVHRVLAAAVPDDPADGGQWARYAEIYSHARMPALSLSECRDQGVRDVTVAVLGYLRLSGDLTACVALAEQFIDRWISDSGEPDHEVVRAQFELAAALREGGDYREARAVTERAYGNARMLLSEQDELTMELRRALAQDLRLSGDFADALALDGETRRLLRATRGATDAHVVLADSDVGLGLLLTSQYGEARDVLARALADYPEGSPPAAVAATRTRLSWAHQLSGDYATAREFAEGARDYARALLGARRPAAIRAQIAEAIALRRLGPPGEARDLAAELLSGAIAALGPRHPDTLAALVNLANCERDVGSPGEALRLTEQAKSGYEAAYGADHPLTHGCVGAIGLIHRLMGDPAVARDVDERALSGLYGRLTPDHHYSLSVAVNLATDLAALGELRQARAMGEDALRRSRALLGEDHPVSLGCAVNLAMDLRADNDPAYADRLRSDAMRRYVRALGGDQPDTKAALAGERINFDFDPPPL